MGSQVHFEIFRRVGAKGGWTLHEVLSSRDNAIALCQTLMAEEKATGVKVVKETYNDDTGDFLSLKIFEDGHNQVKIAPAQEDAPHAIPCFQPADLYSYHARATMTRLLADFLARNKVTITELIHRADLLEKLEATGTLYQHAIQKIAVAQAASTTTPVQQIVKSLNELTTQAFNRVYRDQKKGLFPDPNPEQFAELALKLCNGKSEAGPDQAYIFNGALARHLAQAKGWDEKVHMLITVLDLAPLADGPRRLVASSVDAMLAETLGGSAALQDLMGRCENLAGALNNLVALFLGKSPDGAKEGLCALTQQFAADTLPEAKTAVAGRIMAEIKSNRRLCPDVMTDELKSLRDIANRLVLGVGKYLSHEDLVAAFTLRSKRLVAQEALGQHIAEAPVAEKLERILFVEDNIIGPENKRQLSSYLAPILNAPAFDSHFHDTRLPLVARLQRLAQLQLRMRRSGFVTETRNEICVRLDTLAMQVAVKGKLFETIEGRDAGNVEKAQTLLKLAVGGILTEGALSAHARELILAHLSRPGFLTGYIASQNKDGATPDSETVMNGLMDTLGKAGITAETGLKSIAA